MSRVLQALLSFIVLLFLANASCVSAKERLLVYTAVEPEFLPLYKEAFEKENPDIEITYIRDSAGPISAGKAQSGRAIRFLQSPKRIRHQFKNEGS